MAGTYLDVYRRLTCSRPEAEQPVYAFEAPPRIAEGGLDRAVVRRPDGPLLGMVPWMA
jgi:hypothetical protein